MKTEYTDEQLKTMWYMAEMSDFIRRYQEFFIKFVFGDWYKEMIKKHGT